MENQIEENVDIAVVFDPKSIVERTVPKPSTSNNIHNNLSVDSSKVDGVKIPIIKINNRVIESKNIQYVNIQYTGFTPTI